MSEKKPGTGDYRDYWLRAHSAEGRDLAAVCFPGKPLWLNRFFDRIQRHALRRALRDAGISPAGRRLLDLGCGRGRWLDFFGRGMGARATGLDVSPEAVRACREKGFDAREGSIE
jgi:SAM-dependent methyltransferase